jgi:hypothetical protein
MTLILIITAVFCFSFGYVAAGIVRDEEYCSYDALTRFLILNKNISVVRDDEGRYALVDLEKNSDVKSIPKNKWCVFVNSCVITFKKD